jgi:flagellar basal body-associated protein FliL
MKRRKETLSGKLFIVYRISLLLLLCMVLVIAGGGIYAILRPSESGPLFRLGNTGRAAAGNSATEAPAETSVFNGIGRLRIPVAGTGDSSAATMIISIAFPYPPDDAPYTEELASKIINFRSISSDYFSSLPATAFVDFNEEIAKTELLKRFNALLRLGKIESLYFNDLLILEAN